MIAVKSNSVNYRCERQGIQESETRDQRPEARCVGIGTGIGIVIGIEIAIEIGIVIGSQSDHSDQSDRSDRSD